MILHLMLEDKNGIICLLRTVKCRIIQPKNVLLKTVSSDHLPHTLASLQVIVFVVVVAITHLLEVSKYHQVFTVAVVIVQIGKSKLNGQLFKFRGLHVHLGEVVLTLREISTI